MITPEEIRLRAAKLFEPAISAWIAGDETFFPCRLRGANLRVTSSTNQSQLIEQVERLRQESKASRGFGYSVRYAEVRKRLHGLNHYPSSIEIDTLRQFSELAAPGLQARQSQEPPQLDALELEALRVCRTQQLRLEQERLPQHHVNRVLQQLISCRANL